MDPHSLRPHLEHLAASGRLTAAGLEWALARLGLLPSAQDWRRAADRGLLALGMLLLIAAVVFFIAFNWNELHRFGKFALVAAPLTASALAAWRLGLAAPSGQFALAAAAALTGVLLATLGQVYQTGADTEALFFGWAALILPWVGVARLAWLWLGWLALINVGLLLFIFGRFDVWMFFFFADGLFWLPLLANAGALALWEGLWPRMAWLQAAWAPRLIALAATAAATALGVSWFWLSRGEAWRVMLWSPLIYAVWLTGQGLWFQHRRRDLLPLALCALSLIMVVSAGIARQLSYRSGFAFEFLGLGLLVAGMTAAAALWLRRLQARWRADA